MSPPPTITGAGPCGRLGTAAALSPDLEVAARAHDGAAIALRARSRWPRAMAYAALGAGRLLFATPEDPAALRLLDDARRVLGRPGPERSWPWPEERLTYANAVLPEAMIVIGTALRDDVILDDGLLLLDWLVDVQQSDGRLSVVPSTGWSRYDRTPGFAQQPIEVAALAEACRTAYEATGDRRWTDVVEQCNAWFVGANDGGVPMCDPLTGGGFDGLERHGASTNQGAESTLAWLSTHQLRADAPARPGPMIVSTDPAWVHRTDHVLRADPTRVVSRIFLPGQRGLPARRVTIRRHPAAAHPHVRRGRRCGADGRPGRLHRSPPRRG